ncbi:hypothetical protein CLOM621_07610 [Clostridium sp. M62/1]|nr:hypothetical protein CLOM621_07610 [Clostridium sp. M62/1]
MATESAGIGVFFFCRIFTACKEERGAREAVHPALGKRTLSGVQGAGCGLPWV